MFRNNKLLLTSSKKQQEVLGDVESRLGFKSHN